jgi:hypothetical protein
MKMTNQHPITPPLELVHQWADMLASRSDQAVFTMAAQWGADQELETCLKHLFQRGFSDADILCLRASRRPNPPSLKAQAQVELDRLIALIPSEGALAMAEPIRRALETLDD